MRDYKSILNEAKIYKTQLEKQLSLKREELNNTAYSISMIEDCQVFLQTMAKNTQEQLSLRIEDIINSALDAVFPDEYEFKLNFNTSRNKTEAELKFFDKRSGKEVDPMNASGGGVVDLTAFALRIACYVLEHNTDNIIVLDEPFRFISRDLQKRAGSILKTLSKKLDIQIIMVTHIQELVDCSDRVFEVKKNSDGISEIKIVDVGAK